MIVVAWEDYLELYRSQEKLLAAVETLIDGAGDVHEHDDCIGPGIDVWVSDFETLKIQMEASRTVLREAPTKPTEGKNNDGNETHPGRSGTAETADPATVGQDPRGGI